MSNIPIDSAPFPKLVQQGSTKADTSAATAQPTETAAAAVEAEQATAASGNSAPPVQRGSLQISIDDKLGSTIITVRDAATEEVIRQIPNEEVVALARFFSEQQPEITTASEPTKGVFMDLKS